MEEIWTPDFQEPTSTEYRTKAHEIERALEELYDTENQDGNKIVAHVVQIR